MSQVKVHPEYTNTFKDVTVSSGMVFWVLWASTQAMLRDPETHAMNLFNAVRNFYPLAGEYDKDLIRDNLAPEISAALGRWAEGPADMIYFLTRTLEIIK